MKKCCGRILLPRIRYRASIIDSIGLGILLSFFLGIACLIAWAAASTLISSVEDGSINERDFFGHRTVPGGVFVLMFLYYFLPKFINASSYFVNYKLTISSVCRACGKEHQLANYPKSEDPF